MNQFIISSHFNDKITNIEDRRSSAGGYQFDARTHKSYHSQRVSGLWRFYLDDLDEALELQKALVYLRLCYIDDLSNITPCIDKQCEINFEEI